MEDGYEEDNKEDHTFLLLCDISESVLVKLLVLPKICQAVAPL